MFFSFSIPVENIIVLPIFGTLSRFFGILMIPVFLFYLLKVGKVRKIISFHILLLVFCIWMSISFFWSSDQLYGYVCIKTMIQILLMLYIMWLLPHEKDIFISITSSYLLGCFFAAINIISDYILNQNAIYYRSTLEGFDPNDIALIISTGISIAWYLSFKFRGVLKIIALSYIPISFLSIFLTASRGGILSTIPTLFFIGLSFKKCEYITKFFLVLLLIISVISIISIVPEWIFDRYFGIGSEISTGTISLRTMIWDSGLSIFQEEPFRGIGIGSFKRSVGRLFGFLVAPHSAYIQILVETGIIGFILFVIVIFQLLWKIRYLSFLEKYFSYSLFLTLAVGISALSWAFKKGTWFIFGLIVFFSYCNLNENKSKFPYDRRVSK